MNTTYRDQPPAIRIEANPKRVRAMFAGHVIADTIEALTVHERGKNPVQYVPRQDVETGYLGKTDQVTYSADIGEACYFTIVMEGEIIEKAIWSYEQPVDEAAALKGYMAFSPRWFEVYELSERDMLMAPRANHVHGGAA